MIYFDNAATTVMSEVALSALTEVSSTFYGNPSAIYGIGKTARDILESSRATIAHCIGAMPEEIYFTSCGTESDNWVVQQAENGFSKFITTEIEHHAILYPAKKLEHKGCSVYYLPVTSACIVEEAELRKRLDGSQSVVSVMLQNNETGTIQDIKKLSKLVHEDNPSSIFHTDAVQAVGHMNIDVKDLGIDVLSASAHKFNGPKGVGFLYINKSCKFLPMIAGGGQEKGMRSGTENVAGIFSMAKALEDNINHLNEIRARLQILENRLFAGLNSNNIAYKINADGESRALGIINITIAGLDGEGLLNMLDMHDICISIGSACNSKSQDRSHVLSAMGLSDDEIDTSVRISIGRYNTEKDVDELVKWIVKCYTIASLAEA